MRVSSLRTRSQVTGIFVIMQKFLMRTDGNPNESENFLISPIKIYRLAGNFRFYGKSGGYRLSCRIFDGDSLIAPNNQGMENKINQRHFNCMDHNCDDWIGFVDYLCNLRQNHAAAYFRFYRILNDSFIIHS